MIYEVELTDGNFGADTPNNHIYITPFRDRLPPDVVGGSTKRRLAPKLMTLEHDGLVCETDVPTSKDGQLRNFFRSRSFARAFFDRTGAKAGDSVVFDHVSPYHMKLSLKRKP